MTKKGDMTLADQGGASMNFDGSGNATTVVNVNNVTNAGSNNIVNAGSTNVINVGGDKDAPDPKSLLKMDASGNIKLEGKTEISFTSGDSSITLKNDGTIEIKGKRVKVIGTETTEVGQAGGDPGVKVGTANMDLKAKKMEITGKEKIDISATNEINLSATEVNSN